MNRGQLGCIHEQFETNDETNKTKSTPENVIILLRLLAQQYFEIEIPNTLILKFGSTPTFPQQHNRCLKRSKYQ